MGLAGWLFLGDADNERITQIAKERNADRDVVEVEYKEMLSRISASQVETNEK